MGMKKIALSAAVLFFAATNQSFALFVPVKGLEAADVRRVALSYLEPSRIYVASSNALYRCDNATGAFLKVASFKDEEVQHIFFDTSLAGRLYVATSRHFYQVNSDLARLFTVSGDEAIYTAAKHNGVFYIGTSQSFYKTREDLLRWEKSKSIIDTPVYSIDSSRDKVYLATGKGVYAFSEPDRIERLFVMREEEDEEYQSDGVVTRTIKVDAGDQNRIWLGTEQGIFVSQDAGKGWNKFFAEGIDNLAVNVFVQTPLQRDVIYAGTNKGFFLIDIAKQRARQLFEGVYSSNIHWAALDAQGKIYLATAKGLFKDDYFSSAYREKSFLEDIAKYEPAIGEVQQAALRYNDVHPEKIRRWRNSLYFRAIMPQLDLDYDKTVNYDSGADQYYTGPRDWGVSFSWDIGDLIWNSYHDDVDTRSRLDTQLRLDILDEINRVYFERLRLKQEIANASLGQSELLKKQMRLAELTAIIDGYTGGFFSKKSAQLQKSKK